MFKTEVVMNNLNPTFKPIVTSMQRLCNGDPFRPILIEAFDWDKDGSHDLIGSCTTTLDDLTKRSQSGERLALINQTKKTRMGASYVNSGLLRCSSLTVTPQPSFLDYITGGCELNFMVRLGVLPLSAAAAAAAASVVAIRTCIAGGLVFSDCLLHGTTIRLCGMIFPEIVGFFPSRPGGR